MTLAGFSLPTTSRADSMLPSIEDIEENLIKTHLGCIPTRKRVSLREFKLVSRHRDYQRLTVCGSCVGI